MEFLKDYDFELLYHLRKANVVADALSRKAMHTTPNDQGDGTVKGYEAADGVRIRVH